MYPRGDYVLFFILVSIPALIHSIFFFDSGCITTTENPLKVHFQDEPLCAACMTLHGAGRLVLGHELSPVRFLLNTGCGLIPPCTIIWTIVSFYFSVTPDRLSCRRLLVCPGDWFDENKQRRSVDQPTHLLQSKELYNILVGKDQQHHFERSGRNKSLDSVDETVLAAVRNVTTAFGVTDQKKVDLFADMVLEGTKRVLTAYNYVTGQQLKGRRIA